MSTKKLKRWNVKRYVLEEFEVEAETREKAKEETQKGHAGPHRVTVLRESVKVVKD